MASNVVEKAKDVLNLNKDDIKIVGQKVHHTGYGLMGLTWRSNPPSQEQCFDAMKTALENKSNFWNGGEIYGTVERNSLHLLREYFEKYPKDASKVVLSIKGGIEKGGRRPDGSAENTRRSIDECLTVLAGTKKLDIWEAARADPTTPIEISMRAANEYVKAGKLGGIALSECSANTIRRAAKEVKVACVEVEFSLFSTQILDNDVAKVCAELDIPIAAYSPLGRGFLTGQIKSPSDMPADDLRHHIPRFYPENFDKNLKVVNELEQISKRKGCSSGQVALAWVRAQSKKPGMPTIIPIPGASSPERVRENLVEVDLSENDLKEIDSLLASAEIAGGRYDGPLAALEHADTPELKE